MKPAMQDRSSLRRTCGGVALAALAVAIVALALRPGEWAAAYRLALFMCLGPTIGALWWALIYRTTGGQWGESLEWAFALGYRWAPWLWMLVLPLLVTLPAAHGYAAPGAVAARSVAYGIVLAFVTWLVMRRRGARWVGPLGLILLVFTLHFAADDWLSSLEPGWQSTAFAAVWMCGQGVSGMAAAVLIALAAGKSPARALTAPRALGLDWGNLLLAAVMFWCYVAFAQFLIIWSGNIPREISWYAHRIQGGWRFVPAVLAVIHFLVPMAILLSRTAKKSPRALGFAAALLLVAQAVYIAWMILPAFPQRTLASAIAGTALAVAAGAGFLRNAMGQVRTMEAAP